ncbi:hypothetical protein LTR99_004066 [Exophiala xenobiotica]|uniref:Uncharacterized protein n=1 Tax=Vermiconidia calcicola TaxID=1690605 RepID=A0AAV9QMF7_9PEZI|nr:hypothetical protein LTR99_004066 [Exophiala xenobiotica]KAK5435535.1 hypothetical protein LTR34_003039 [Exophiala xenobiotica]KAK5545172.1 hypothetical protein LTR25_000179 [Vermiconidia calcicola]KAK5549182.1 hypothetical protein LTR23_001012 [Chaetothyriales sp. CCFEE 6169]
MDSMFAPEDEISYQTMGHRIRECLERLNVIGLYIDMVRNQPLGDDGARMFEIFAHSVDDLKRVMEEGLQLVSEMDLQPLEIEKLQNELKTAIDSLQTASDHHAQQLNDQKSEHESKISEFEAKESEHDAKLYEYIGKVAELEADKAELEDKISVLEAKVHGLETNSSEAHKKLAAVSQVSHEQDQINKALEHAQNWLAVAQAQNKAISLEFKEANARNPDSRYHSRLEPRSSEISQGSVQSGHSSHQADLRPTGSSVPTGAGKAVLTRAFPSPGVAFESHGDEEPPARLPSLGQTQPRAQKPSGLRATGVQGFLPPRPLNFQSAAAQRQPGPPQTGIQVLIPPQSFGSRSLGSDTSVSPGGGSVEDATTRVDEPAYNAKPSTRRKRKQTASGNSTPQEDAMRRREPPQATHDLGSAQSARARYSARPAISKEEKRERAETLLDMFAIAWDITPEEREKILGYFESFFGNRTRTVESRIMDVDKYCIGPMDRATPYPPMCLYASVMRHASGEGGTGHTQSTCPTCAFDVGVGGEGRICLWAKFHPQVATGYGERADDGVLPRLARRYDDVAEPRTVTRGGKQIRWILYKRKAAENDPDEEPRTIGDVIV